MYSKAIFLILFLFVIINANAQVAIDSARKMDDINEIHKEEIPTQCRSDVGHNNESSIEQGFIGKFKGKPLYYEVWRIYGSVGTESNYILLRTDTTNVDSLDICLPLAEYGSDYRDTVIFMRADSNGTFYYASDLTERNFPTLFQILNYGDYGYQYYSDLNKDKNQGIYKNQRIYIKGNILFIKHWEFPRYDDALLKLDSYKYDGRRFTFHSSKILKREKRN